MKIRCQNLKSPNSILTHYLLTNTALVSLLPQHLVPLHMRINALAVVVRFATLDALVLGIGAILRHLGRFLTGSRCHVLLLVMVCTKRFIAQGTHELPQPHVLVVFAMFAKELPFDVLLALVTLARIGRRTFGTDGGRPVQLVHVSDVPVEDASLGVTLEKSNWLNMCTINI